MPQRAAAEHTEDRHGEDAPAIAERSEGSEQSLVLATRARRSGGWSELPHSRAEHSSAPRCRSRPWSGVAWDHVAVQGDLAEHLQPSRRAAGHRRLDDATEDFFDRFDAYLDIERHPSLSRVSAIQRAPGRICAGSMRRSVNGHRGLPTDGHEHSPGSATRDIPTLGNRASGGSRETPLRASSTSAPSGCWAMRWDAEHKVLSDAARSPTALVGAPQLIEPLRSIAVDECGKQVSPLLERPVQAPAA